MSAVLMFSGGLIGLLVAGHAVVDAAAKIGARFGLSPLVIGITIVAAGTSAPELAVVFQSVAAEDTELAVGSVIGSNIANVLLVLGLATLVGTIHISTRLVRIDIPVMILASLALLLTSLDGRLSRTDGILLFSGLLLFVGWTLRVSRNEVAVDTTSTAHKEASGSSRTSKKSPSTHHRISTLVATLVVAIAGLAFAARAVVSGAESIASSLGVPELIVGLTIVALGTSAPEIVTTLLAVLRGQRELAVGNAVGSNIFNILLVLGTTSALAPNGIPISSDATALDIPILLAAAVACLPLVFWDHKLDRWEGAVFVGYYAAYLAFLTLDATDHHAADRFGFVMLVFVLPLTVLTAGVGIAAQRTRHPGPTKHLPESTSLN